MKFLNKESRYPIYLNTDVITSIKEYCSCLGHKYFDNFTKEDNQWLIKNGSLPPRIASKRSQYQMQCWE